jgi:hypothetical protein
MKKTELNVENYKSWREKEEWNREFILDSNDKEIRKKFSDFMKLGEEISLEEMNSLENKFSLEYVQMYNETYRMTSLDDRDTLVSDMNGYVKIEEINQLKEEFISNDIFEEKKKEFRHICFCKFEILNGETALIETVDGADGKNYIYQKTKKGQFYEVESSLAENPTYLKDKKFLEALAALEPRACQYAKKEKVWDKKIEKKANGIER